MSLRRRLTVLCAAAVAITLVAFTWITVSRTRTALDERGDMELATLATGLRAIAATQVTRVEEGRRPLQYRPLELLQLDGVVDGYAVVVLPDGSTVPLPRLTSARVVPTLPDDLDAHVDAGPFDVPVPDGPPYRGLVTSVPDTDAVMFLALSTQGLDGTGDSIVRAHLLAGGVLLVTVVAAIAGAVWIGLRPLERLTRAARRMSGAGADTVERLPAARDGTEVGDLTTALNELLDGIRAAIAERDRAHATTEQFAADAAHELRTPVAAIAGYADLYAQGGIPATDRARLDEVFERIRSQAARLGELVESLLVLNRLDQAGGSRVGICDLSELTAAVAADSMTIDPRHPVTVAASGPVWVGLPADHVVHILANLLANVRHHTPPGTESTVEITVPPVGATRASVTVSDDGPGIDPENRERVFDRFYRGDTARGRGADDGTGAAPPGSGLGLAIVAALVRDAGGAARVDAGPDGGTSIQLTLPLAAAPAPRTEADAIGREQRF